MRNLLPFFIYILILFNLSIEAQTWNTQMVNAGQINGSQSIGSLPNGWPYIIYVVATNRINYSAYNGTSWVTTSHHTTRTIGTVNSIRIDSIIYITWNDVGWLKFLKLNINGTLLYNEYIFQAPNSSNLIQKENYILMAHTNVYSKMVFHKYDIQDSIWMDEVEIDGNANLKEPSIAISPSGTVWIAYYDDEGDNLKVARSNDGVNWNYWFVDTEGEVGRNSEIWVDDSNIAHIAYYDATNQRLKYATFNP